MRLIIPAAVLAALAAPLTAPLAAQSRIADEGTFVVTQNGAPIGRETFRITRQAGTGEAYRAVAQVVVGDRRGAPTLATDSLGGTISYDLTVRERSEPVLRVTARSRPGRLSVQENTPRGESVKEYVVPSRVVLLDDDMFHLFHFIALWADSGAVQVVLPRARSLATLRIARVGTERMEVGVGTLATTRYTLTFPDASVHEFWLDDARRVVRVAIPARGIVAQRDELPR